jgi:hypothetical protein
MTAEMTDDDIPDNTVTLELTPEQANEIMYALENYAGGLLGEMDGYSNLEGRSRCVREAADTLGLACLVQKAIVKVGA